MYYLTIFFTIVGANYVFCEDLLPKPCDIADTECLNNSTQTFLEKTAAGIPELNIFPLDPLIIPLVDVGKNKEVDVYLKNIVVTGLKSQQISDFKVDRSTKSVVLATRANLTITADMVIELPGKLPVNNTKYTGTVTAKARPVGTAKYGYSLYKDDKGVEYFSVGPEVTTCDNESDPEIVYSDSLEKAISSEPTIKELKEKDDTLTKKMICKVVEVAYVTVVHNIRSSAKLLPKSAFFTSTSTF